MNNESRNVCFRLNSPNRAGRCYVCRVSTADMSADGNAVIVTRELDNRINAAFDHVRQGESVCACIVPDDAMSDAEGGKIVNLVAYDKFAGRYVDWRCAYNLFA